MDAIFSQYLTNVACILQACYERRRGIYCIASESSCIIIEKCWCPPLVFGIRFIISRPDKTPLAADISHRISTSQLKELVHSVICQQVLRLCQTQRHKRQPSQKQTQRQNSGWRRRGREGEPSPTGPSMAASPGLLLEDAAAHWPSMTRSAPEAVTQRRIGEGDWHLGCRQQLLCSVMENWSHRFHRAMNSCCLRTSGDRIISAAVIELIG